MGKYIYHYTYKDIADLINTSLLEHMQAYQHLPVFLHSTKNPRY